MKGFHERRDSGHSDMCPYEQPVIPAAPFQNPFHEPASLDCRVDLSLVSIPKQFRRQLFDPEVFFFAQIIPFSPHASSIKVYVEADEGSSLEKG